MGLDKVALRQVITVAKNSSRLKKSITDMENKVIDSGLELIEKAGIDPNTLPIDVRSVLRGEAPTIDSSKLLTPEIICAQPLMSIQQREETSRLITGAEDKVSAIYATTNSIKETVLSLQEPVVKLQEKTLPVTETINTVADIVTIIKLLALPTSFPPGAGVPLSVPNTFASTLITLGELLEAARASVNLIPTATTTLVNLLNTVTTPLNKLNLVIDPFVNVLGMVKAVVDLQDVCPLLTQADIDANKASLMANIRGQLATIDSSFAVGLSNVLEERLTPNAANPYIYKNFRFVLESNPVQEFSFPSRRIKAIRANSTGISDGIAGGGSIIVYNNNPTTNPELEEGAYSYASNINVLIAEGKFAIDVYTNNVTIWTPPPVRERVSGSSGTFITSGNEEYQEAYLEQFGFLPSPSNKPLPTFVRYGSRQVNLNGSATDVEFGADALISGRVGSVVPSIPITSYITSGTIQVNKPVSIKMSTFGGTDSGNLGYTEALLTIRRSFAIQDNINPYTGRVAGFNQSAIDDFKTENGSGAISILETLYQTFNEDTLNIGALPNTVEGGRFNVVKQDMEDGLTYAEKLKYVRSNYFGDNGSKDRVSDSRIGGLLDFIVKLYDKTKPLLYNEQVLSLSNKLYGTRYKVDLGNSGDASGDYRRKVLEQGKNDLPINWYWAARKNAYEESRLDDGQNWKKAATLSMMWEFSNKIIPLYNSLFNQQSSPSYNGGAWTGGATGIPIIPTQVSTDNPDIVVALQATQLANRNERINEEVGGLDLLGTYTYDLEIIGSIPEEGGSSENYPTNFTFFTIEDT
jgi:hypothetical protein|tara:strand:+ start:1350 stop:3770 length:2421 start_codon:yes stop_codon:yes gene_type:complete